MRLGKIVSSYSHLQYRCQIYTRGEVPDPPAPDDYGLGTYVTVPLGDDRSLVGIVCDTLLHNPEYAVYGPRLSTPEETTVFSPDYLDEARTLVSIIAIGYVDSSGCHHDPPQTAPLLNSEVLRMSPEQVRKFHHADDQVRLGYLPLLIALARTTPVMTQTILRLLTTLEEAFPDGPASTRLRLVRQNLSWQFRVLSLA
ncbi:MAG: hypothetical protein HPY83_04605 [Anaerolineae bacterium]|nr:hypothetical protein [Anaerolineae bacterium]